MENGKKRVEQFLSVGEQIFLEVAGPAWSKRIKTRFRGWIAGEYILLDAPCNPSEGGYILKDAACVVRFIHDGCACGFDSKILDWCDMGPTFFRVGWPATVKVLHVRKHARIPVTLPCVITRADGEVSGTIVDLSSGGCGLVAPQSFAEGTRVSLSFELPDGFPVEKLSSVICRSRPHEGGIFLGCNFAEDNTSDYSALFFFVSTTLSRMGLERLAERRVLVVHPEHADLRDLLHAFDLAGIHAVTADNMVDAFYRLRMTKPGAVLLHVRQTQFSVDGICQAIRQTPGFASMPLILMGGDERGDSLCAKCGAQAWFTQDCVYNEPGKIVAACLRHAVRNSH